MNTHLVNTYSNFFSGCKALTSINFGSTYTRKIEYMDSMFFGCKSLLSLDLSTFDTSGLIDAEQAFKECSSLSYINMDNFDTTQANSLMSMFHSCTSLTSLYLPKFHTMNVGENGFNSIFEGCNEIKLSLYSNKCPNLISILPSNIELIDLLNHDINI